MKTILALLFLAIPLQAQSHSVVLTWVDSTSPGVSGYNVYRLTNPSSTQCPAGGSITGFTLLTTTPLDATATTYTDASITSANSFCYGVVALSPGGQSLPSNLVLLPQGPSGLTLTGVQ